MKAIVEVCIMEDSLSIVTLIILTLLVLILPNPESQSFRIGSIVQIHVRIPYE